MCLCCIFLSLFWLSPCKIIFIYFLSCPIVIYYIVEKKPKKKQDVGSKGYIHHPNGEFQYAFPDELWITACQSFEGFEATDKVLTGANITEAFHQLDIKSGDKEESIAIKTPFG